MHLLFIIKFTFIVASSQSLILLFYSHLDSLLGAPTKQLLLLGAGAPPPALRVQAKDLRHATVILENKLWALLPSELPITGNCFEFFRCCGSQTSQITLGALEVFGELFL